MEDIQPVVLEKDEYDDRHKSFNIALSGNVDH